MSFCYVDEWKTEKISDWGHCVEFAHSPPLCVGFFLGTWGSSHIPEMVMLGSLASLSRPSWVSVGVSAARGGRVSGPGLFPPCASSCWGRLLTPVTLNWNKRAGKWLPYLFSLIFLKCVSSSHLFQCVIWEAFGVLTEKIDCVIHNQEYFVGTLLFFIAISWW